MKSIMIIICIMLVLVPPVVCAQGAGSVITLENASQLSELAVLSLPAESGAGGVAWSPDSAQIASGASSDDVYVWDVATWEEVTMLNGDNGGIHDLTWSPDGTMIAVANRVTSAHVWDVNTGSEALLLGQPVAAPSLNMGALSGDSVTMDSLLSMGAAYGSFEEQMQVYGQILDEFSFKAVDWSPDGRWIATATSNLAVFWDAETGEEKGSVEGFTDNVWTVDWSPDSTVLVAASIEEMLIVTPDFETDKVETVSIPGFNLDAVWNSTGEYLALIGDKEIMIWDVEAQEAVTTIAGLAEHQLSIAWSPDDTMVASGGLDQQVHVWDAATGEELAVLSGHGSDVNRVEWSPDGTMLASAAYDDTVRVWAISE
ncbi:MAG: WD40 repeat domain-containing protein [Anaerolineae bacterium]|nr:WD40 repeat domain-containing protein [Anaerolineae bacterium]